MSLINEIICDHEDFFKVKLLQATFLLKADSSSWIRIRNNLSPKYKFTVDLDTFCETLGAGICVLPYRGAIYKKNASLIDFYIRYNFEHGQDAAVKEMVSYGLSERNKLEFNPSLTIKHLNHRFASSISTDILGIMRLKTDDMTEKQINNIINTWEYVYKNAYSLNLSYDGYHSFLENT